MRREISIFLKLWQHDNHPSRPSPGLQPATRRWRAFVMPSFRPPLHPRSTLPPPRRSGLRYPPPVGHGRGLASRPGCTGPGEGVGSPWLHLATSGVRRYCSAPPTSARLRPASPTPGETPQRSCQPIGSQPLLALHATLSVCLWWCRTDSGGATAGQHCCHVHRRQPLAVVLRFARTRIYYARCLR